MNLKEMINCQINIIKREKHSWLMFNFHFPSALIKKIIFKIYPQTWVAAHIAFSFYEPVPKTVTCWLKKKNCSVHLLPDIDKCLIFQTCLFYTVPIISM